MMTLDFGNITRLIMLNSESKLVLDNLNITGKSLLPAAGQQRPGLAGAFRPLYYAKTPVARRLRRKIVGASLDLELSCTRSSS